MLLSHFKKFFFSTAPSNKLVCNSSGGLFLSGCSSSSSFSTSSCMLSSSSQNRPSFTRKKQKLHTTDELVEHLYSAMDKEHALTSTFSLPSRAKMQTLIAMLRKIIFPGMFEDYEITSDNVKYHLGMLISEAKQILIDQIQRALIFRFQETQLQDENTCLLLAKEKAALFLETLPHLRRLLYLDIDSSMRGDPAATTAEEILLCYPGTAALFSYRIAHELYLLQVPLIPRIISELAHQATAIDIHPGANIGSSLFIDHGTGVVIGETCRIGNNVKLFHGVTLGALSTKDGQKLAGKKRHPTIEDDVTIYAGAVILGGATVIGKGATIGGSCFLTSSVPAGQIVTAQPAALSVRPSSGAQQRSATSSDTDFLSFDPAI